VELTTPAIYETNDEKALSDQDLKRACFTYAKEHFQGKAFRNRALNVDITVSSDGLGEWKSKTKSREQILSIKILDALLESGGYWKEEQPKDKDPNIAKVIYLRQNCQINGNLFTAIITIKVYFARNYHKYYHHYLDEAALAQA
jgi:hypothetical protein